MKAPQQSQAGRHAPERRLSRRSLLGSVTAATFAAATMRSSGRSPSNRLQDAAVWSCDLPLVRILS